MLLHGLSYDAGRLGAEIAYMIGRSKLHLPGLIIREPSAGGRDLFTRNGYAGIQTRLLKDVPAESLKTALQVETHKLVAKLEEDFAHNSQMQTGFAVISCSRGTGTIESLVIDVPRRVPPRELRRILS
jgi:hypothetical protein